MPATKKIAPKATKATKATAAKKATATKVRTKATATKATAPKKAAPKAPASTWVRQSTVTPEDGMAVSRFTTQSQRRLLRGLAKVALTRSEVSPATGRSIDRLASLGLVSETKAGKVSLSAAGKVFVKENPAPKVR